MVNSFFFVSVVFFAFATTTDPALLQDKDVAQSSPQSEQVRRSINWNKEFDPSIETDPKRRMLARQYAALRPVTEKMRELFVHERISAISILHLEVRQLEIRWQLETDLQEKKKCLDVLVYNLKQIQDSFLLEMERPVRPMQSGVDRLGKKAVDNLVDSTLELVKWEMELELLVEKLNSKK